MILSGREALNENDLNIMTDGIIAEGSHFTTRKTSNN